MSLFCLLLHLSCTVSIDVCRTVHYRLSTTPNGSLTWRQSPERGNDKLATCIQMYIYSVWYHPVIFSLLSTCIFPHRTNAYCVLSLWLYRIYIHTVYIFFLGNIIVVKVSIGLTNIRLTVQLFIRRKGYKCAAVYDFPHHTSQVSGLGYRMYSIRIHVKYIVYTYTHYIGIYYTVCSCVIYTNNNSTLKRVQEGITPQQTTENYCHIK